MSDKPRLIADYEHEIARLARERDEAKAKEELADLEADILRAALVTLVRHIDGELSTAQAQASIDIARQEWAEAQQREKEDR
jgi:hypothetical protein